MIKQTRGQIIVVADHSKWGVVSNFQIAPIEEIDRLVTDAAFDRGAFESLEAHRPELLIAAPHEVLGKWPSGAFSTDPGGSAP